ncbi:enoyl-CoA hydratase/isomerase family protein [Bordetella petrii]|uniref:enoyl-CoA hydratase/isomerase family protein n=1 Tax=Bordetella petrii TaxID=94624 RepID=UPI001E439F43|nr:enoyl-CoA hydratase/isomerase family protein [Bordetella petrii]MCD0502833.1 enoyl-CoA hydratase/isomerase family protein [Bordetella petrii]
MEPSFQAATLRIEDGVAEFVHANPASRNAMSMALRNDYARMLDIVAADESVRVVLLRGSGGSFCAGGDLNEMASRMQDPAHSTPVSTRRRLGQATPWLRRLLELDALVIAEVDGAAAGAGFSLALHADLVLASSRARFCMSFPRIGAVPDFGAHYLLPRIAGLSAARGIILTGRTVGAPEALALGIAHAIHAPQELADAARALAAQVCRGPADALAMSKRMLNQSFDTDYASLANQEALSQAVAMSAAYHRAAVERFVGKQAQVYDWDRDGAATGIGGAPAG